MVTMVYMDPKENNRSRNWNKIKVMGQGWRGLWLCIRYFNDIRNQNEKTGGQPNEKRNIDKFNGLINELALIKLGFKGHMFTWCNNWQGNTTVKERLDHALGNVDWIISFPVSQLIVDPAIDSYHSPITLKLCHKYERGRKIFRFEEVWLEIQECKGMIQRSWQMEEALPARLYSCGWELVKWSNN